MGTEAKQIEEPTTAQLLSTLMDAYCDVDSTMRPSEYHAIYACVNACSGIPTAALEAGVVGELVKACEAAIKCIAMMTPFPVGDAKLDAAIDVVADDADKVRDKLRAALARAKGVAND